MPAMKNAPAKPQTEVNEDAVRRGENRGKPVGPDVDESFPKNEHLYIDPNTGEDTRERGHKTTAKDDDSK